MRMLIGLLMALICLACEPSKLSPNEFPKDFLRSHIKWQFQFELIYRQHDFDTIGTSEIGMKDELSWRLKADPTYEIQQLRLQNDTEAIFLFEESFRSDTLEYENRAQHLRLWYTNKLDEQFCFHLKDMDTQLNRRFYFYWKEDHQHRNNRIYLRTPEGLPNHIKTMLDQHLIYDAFLEIGDTLQIVGGAIIYDGKE